MRGAELCDCGHYSTNPSHLTKPKNGIQKVILVVCNACKDEIVSDYKQTGTPDEFKTQYD